MWEEIKFSPAFGVGELGLRAYIFHPDGENSHDTVHVPKIPFKKQMEKFPGSYVRLSPNLMDAGPWFHR